jgi:response regulator of citrate/malate metabolism
MIAPDELQRRLREWADTHYPNRAQAADTLAAALGVSHNAARGYIDYRLDRVAYTTVYGVWRFLERSDA